MAVFRWDLDKTYLATDFHSLGALVRTALESARQKRNVPGTAALLRELSALPDARIYFVSGSPEQLRKVLLEKLRLDGVRCDGFVLKPNLRNVLRLRLRALREQVGYKLPALLQGRLAHPEAADEYLFGDDAESDGLVYSLYADVLAGRADADRVAAVLARRRAYPDTIARVRALAAAAPRGDVVRRIFIHLESRSPPARFDLYGARLVPVFNALQTAAVLDEHGVLDEPAVLRVAEELVGGYGYDADTLANSLQDVVRRGRLARATALRIARAAPQRLARAIHDRLAALAHDAGPAPFLPTPDYLDAAAGGPAAAP